jgi:hypothetical protein
MSGLRRLWRRSFSVVLCAVLACAAVPGISLAAGGPEDEPGIARVSLIEGDASYLRGDGDDWTGVAVNAPLVTGDRFYSGADSRAEIQLDPTTYARLSSETEVSMLELGPDVTQVRMSLGLATFRVRRNPDGHHVEIDTPGGAFVVREAGAYRIKVARDGNTDLQVHSGEVTAYVSGEQYQVGDGRGVAIDGIGDAARPRIYAASGSDGWDEWESQRAGRIENAVSTQYVSEDIYGAADLDDYGDWESTGDYGAVWRPRVDAGWAPYTDGRWVWVDPWGWTWLDYAPWGWAPFHYGRWVYTSGYWGWAPGPIVSAPIYAPALVGWYGGGWGGGVSVGIGFGAIGWTPLGWGEPCYPWWGGWGGVAVGSPWWGGWGGPRIKNVTNITINNYNYNNIRRPGGFSSMPIGDFQNGRGRPVPVGSQRLDNFRAIDGRVPVMPTRGSLPATNPSRGAGGRAIQPPSNVEGRSVMTARTPTAAPQPSFDRKLPQIQRGQGAPLTPTTLRQLGGTGGRAPVVQSVGAQAIGTGRQGRTLPAVTTPDSGAAPTVEARGTTGRTAPFAGDTTVPRTSRDAAGTGTADGFERAGQERAGIPRQSMTMPGSRVLPDGSGSAADTPAGASQPVYGSRTVTRPPTTADDGGRAMPVAPRSDGSAGRQPYVARRPAWSPPDGGGGMPSNGGASTGANEVGRGSVSPRAGYGSGSDGTSSPGGGRASTMPRTGSPGTAPRYGSVPSNPTVRSPDQTGGNADGGASRALPGGSMTRTMPSAPRSGSAPATSPPSVRSAPAPDRGGGARSYFSTPRTVTSAPRGESSDPRTATRTTPSYAGAPQSGAWPRTASAPRSYGAYGGSPQVRSAPSGQLRAPSSGYGMRAPSSAPSYGRSMPSSGGSMASRSLSTGMSRAYSGSVGRSAGGFASGGGGGGFARGGGGMGGGSGGGGGRSSGGRGG